LQKKIWDFKCPQCWTGCDGYQSIMGNLIYLFRNNTSGHPTSRLGKDGRPEK
jgi:hypothetical protein